jgi:beta-phosphoglucomutase-like phosphatase (HAD superfamily)
MRLEALIFDVDGTLADNEEAHRVAFNRAFEEHGLSWHWTPAQYRELLKTAGGKERMRAYLDGEGLDAHARRALEDLIPDVHRTKTRLYGELLRGGHIKLREGVPELLDLAASLGMRLAIATTTSFPNVEALLGSQLGHGALERFAAIVAGDAVAKKKPAPDVYVRALKHLGCDARHCIAFEDSRNGIESAQGAGLFTVVTPTAWTQDEDLSAADQLLPSLRAFDLKAWTGTRAESR